MSARIVRGVVIAGATAYGAKRLQDLPPYCPTPISLVQNVMPLLSASVSGIVGYRYERPETFNSKHRALIAEGPDHVANVNASLNERGIEISDTECVLIDTQSRLGVVPGSPFDSALEYVISESFYDSYQRDIEQGQALSDVANEYQMTQVRLNASNNLLGSYLHAVFDKAKVIALGVSETLHLEEHEVAEYGIRHSEQKFEAIALCEKALKATAQYGDIKERCAAFRQKLVFFRAGQEDTQLDQSEQVTPSVSFK